MGQAGIISSLFCCMEEFVIVGKKYIRTGACNQCGQCCIACPHLEIRDGKSFCLIYDHRGDDCNICSIKYKGKKKVNHKVCIDFPNNPCMWVVRDGICGYKFEEVK